MENKKQEAIRKAYGEYADIALMLCDENGWIEQFDYFDYFPQDKEEKRIQGLLYQRPKSLAGIENNNGWVAIESDEDLPKDSYNYLVVCSNGSVKNLNDFEYYKKYIIPELSITHYQPIIKPLPPIY